MCLCGALGASAGGLPDEVLSEAKAFFQASRDNLIRHGLTPARAIQVPAALEGAILLANVLGHPNAFDETRVGIS